MGNLRYLKWDGEIIGTIDESNAVSFLSPNFNSVVELYTRGENFWPPEKFNEFLSERAVSRERRDIERLLFRMGLSRYDVKKIAEVTRAIHPKDLFWIANFKEENFKDAVTDVFSSVFLGRVDIAGESVDTPEGFNVKRYGVHNGSFGIYKQRISPLTADAESEAAVYLLGRELGVPVCPAFKTDKDTVFSTFLFDFSKEYIVHFRRLFNGARSENEYQNLLAARPQLKDSIERMILLDFITRQDDRHLSNMAIKVSGGRETFYPLYDNGRSLFYEDTEETVRLAVKEPEKYATSFGYSGTYFDYAGEIARGRKNLNGLINLNINEGTVKNILKESGFTGYRFEGAYGWILKTLERLSTMFSTAYI